MKKRVLFVCVHNSVRSQMAEGFLRAIYGDYYEVYSAGSQPRGVHPLAIKVMEEVGIDISSHTSDLLDRYLNQTFDYVVTVCDPSREFCPVVPGAKRVIHHSFPDPSTFAEEERLSMFRQVRDQIRLWIVETFKPELMTSMDGFF